MSCVVLIPEGHIALGKLAQALVHGAQVLQVRANFDDALKIVRELPDHAPIVLVNSVNNDRIEGQKTGAFEIVDALGDAPMSTLIPVGQRRQHHGVLARATSSTKLPAIRLSARMCGFQAAGAAPIVLGHPSRIPRRSRRRFALASRLFGTGRPRRRASPMRD